MEGNLKVLFYLILIVFFIGCKPKLKKCEVKSSHLSHYFQQNILSKLENEYKNLSIYISNRGGRHLVLATNKNLSKEEVRFRDFYVDKPNKMNCNIPDFKGNKGYSEKIANSKVDTKKYIQYWHNQFVWLVNNKIESLSSHNWGFSVSLGFQDSTYHQLKENNTNYFDKNYSHIERNMIDKNCNILYNYKLFLFTDKSKINDVLETFSTRHYFYKVNDFAFVTRDLSGNCSLDFSYENCDLDY